MNAIWELFNGHWAEIWGAVLLHFIWQGLLIASITSLAMRLFAPTNSTARYLVLLTGLACMLIAPAATFATKAHRETSPNSPVAYTTASLNTDQLSVDSVLLPLPHDTGADSDFSESTTTGVVEFPRDSLAGLWGTLRVTLLVAWVLVEILSVTRLAVGAVFLWRIRRRAQVLSDDLLQRARQLSKQLGLRSIPRVMASHDVFDAATYGLFRSVILLPASWLTEMSPEMIEAVLAHELSHVKRFDAWVTLLQRAVETLFFYHPAVWWLSRHLTVEREHSCDAMAVRLTGDRRVVAETLEAAARKRASLKFALVSHLGGNKMSLLNRINRVLNLPPTQTARSRNTWGLAVAMIPVLLLVAVTMSESLAVDPPPEAARPVADETVPNGAKIWTFSKVSGVADTNATTGATPKLGTISVTDLPSERSKITLPDYVIEPPDVLLIEGVKMVPKPPVRLALQDIIQIVVDGTPPNAPVAGQYMVEETGEVSLGPLYGSVKLSGLTTIEAATAVKERVMASVNTPKIKASVTMFQAAGQQYITGEHLVAQDGTVNLGIYGRVYVAGKTVKKARAAIEKHLLNSFAEVKIAVDVYKYNSKFFYIINERGGVNQQTVVRLPITGSETVLDAIAQVGGLKDTSNTKIWISRPTNDAVRTDQVLPVDWEAITRGSNSSSNYQLLPGDRLFLSKATEKSKGRRVSEVVERFNRFVENREYQKAIKIVAEMDQNLADKELLNVLQHHAKLLQDNLDEVNAAERQEVASQIAAVKRSRLAELATLKALRQPIEAKFNDVELSAVVKTIAQHLDIDIVIDSEGIAAEGIDRSSKVSLNLRRKIRAESVLRLILEPWRLEYAIKADGVVQVTSRSAAGGDVYTITYRVDDLIGLPIAVDGSNPDQKFDHDALANLITTTVSPESWDDVGGPGTVQPFPARRCLVVSAKRKVHGEIVSLFNELRHAATAGK